MAPGTTVATIPVEGGPAEEVRREGTVEGGPAMTTARAIQERERALRGGDDRGRSVNVGEVERMASKVGGGVLVGLGLMKGGLKGLVLAGLGGALLYRGASGHCSLYEALGADTADEHEPGPSGAVPAGAGVRVEEAITIDRSPEEVYRFWRDHANLPRFMHAIESVTSEDGVRSHWKTVGALGVGLEWDAEIFEDKPGELIAFRSTGGHVDTAGSIHFSPAPSGRGTIVRVNQKINPPLGKAAVAVAKLFGQGPEGQTRQDLRRLKQLLETGEIPTVAGQPSGRA